MKKMQKRKGGFLGLRARVEKEIPEYIESYEAERKRLPPGKRKHFDEILAIQARLKKAFPPECGVSFTFLADLEGCRIEFYSSCGNAVANAGLIVRQLKRIEE